MRAEQTATALPANLRALREAKGLTQVELAVAAGVSPATVFRVEAGKRPRLDTLEQFAAVLGVSVTELIDSTAGAA